MRNLGFLLFCTTLLGCPKNPAGSAGAPTDPLPIILAAVGSGSALATLSADLAYEKGDLAGCITGYSIAAALTTAGKGIGGNLTGGTLPSVDFDISDCLEILEDGAPIGEDVPGMVGPIMDTLLIGATTVITAYSSKLKCEESAWALATITYTSGVAPAVLEEINAPDGIVSFNEVIVDLESCEED